MALARVEADDDWEASRKDRRVGKGFCARYTSCADGLFCKAVPMTQRAWVLIWAVEDSAVKRDCNGSQSLNFSRSGKVERIIVR